MSPTTTKKKILLAAIDLFSTKGYNNCTVQDIAAEVSISAAAIYRHYTGKEDILQSIFTFYEIHFNKYRIPVEQVLRVADQVPPNQLLSMLFFTFGTGEERQTMVKASRVIASMVYTNEDANKLWQNTMLDEPHDYLDSAFSALIAAGKIKPFNYQPLGFQMVSLSQMLLSMVMMERITLKQSEMMFQECLLLLSFCFDRYAASDTPPSSSVT